LAGQTITVTSSGAALIGQPGATLDEPTGFYGDFINLKGSNHLILGLTFQGHLWNSAGLSSTGKSNWTLAYVPPITSPTHICCALVFSGSTVTITQNRFLNYGFSMAGGCSLHLCKDIVITSNYFENVTQGPLISSGNHEDVVISQNTVVNSYDDAIAVQACAGGNNCRPTDVSGIIVSNNNVNQNPVEGSCLDLFSPWTSIRNIVVQGNVFRNCSYGIWVQNVFGHLAGDNYMIANLSITGNIITSRATRAICIQSPYYVANIQATISGNTISSPYEVFSFDNVSDVTISGNTIRQLAAGTNHETFLIQDSQNLTFVGNTIQSLMFAPYVTETSVKNPVSDIVFMSNQFWMTTPSSADNGFRYSTFVPGATVWANDNMAFFIAGASKYTFVDTYGYAVSSVLFNPNGISQFVCNGNTLSLTRSTQCNLSTGQNMTVTWSGAAPRFNLLPNP
jgi:hypothetical protein